MICRSSSTLHAYDRLHKQVLGLQHSLWQKRRDVALWYFPQSAQLQLLEVSVLQVASSDCER